MSAGLPSDEVAEDYKNSLEDLNQNSRYEISNLTIIAKENMDHALAISRVLENHIKTAPPNRKLTALYVLDSVVKNVGTPYTLFFGRNLYQTFMNAYTLVDSPVRKKLEEMLKTWKEPVPGSLDSRPVFPVEVTRNIENALIKARTAAVQLQQQQQQQARGQSGRSPTPWRNTPTPPGFRPADPSSMQHQMYLQQQPNPPGHVSSPYRAPQATNGVNTFNNHAQSAQFQPYVPQQQNPVSLAQQGGSSVSHVSVGALNDDISHLIARARAEFAANPLDTGIQQRLKALFDLQEILQSQSLPFEQLKQIHDQVSQLSLGSNAPPQVPAPQPTIPNLPQPLQHISPQKQQPPPQQQQSASLQSLFPPNALAALMASVVPPQQATPPPPTLPGLQQSHAQSQLPEVRASGPASSLAGQQAASSETGENPLIQALRAAGMLTSVQNTNSHPDSLPVKPPPSNVSPHVLLSRNSQQNGGTKNHSSISDVRNDATLTSSSLKM
ncbi:MAG: hypothetical protein M1837_004628 [Sclerophora amabilis]|nr:MAG: hypothetical protein M1837_004628 [Sclerophora amabilis]